MSDAQDFASGGPGNPRSHYQSDAEWFARWVREGTQRTAEMFTQPESARAHFREARVEFWRGIRELVDCRINNLSGKGARKGTSVVVE